MISVDDLRIKQLVDDWHEFSRPVFERNFQNLDHDVSNKKSVKDRRKYICLDSGQSGCFVVEKATGNIYTIKKYGVPNRIHLIGVLGLVIGEQLHQHTYLSKLR